MAKSGSTCWIFSSVLFEWRGGGCGVSKEEEKKGEAKGSYSESDD